MAEKRINHSITMIDENTLFIVGGSDSKVSRKCELYNIAKSESVSASTQCKEGRENSGICHNSRDENVYVCGGWMSGLSCEYFNLHKQQWYCDIPAMNDEHMHFPHVWMQPPCVHSTNGVLFVAGNVEDIQNLDDLGIIEYIDLRDSNQKWIPIGLMKDFLDINNETQNITTEHELKQRVLARLLKY
ncbi:hypothetical protein RFI_04220 [Reticulomyxa filosa]|uniref:Kelch motif family protein n=1 Tax=Reticulomyxa filosa TaxID=46433 RepID=X6P5M5_RETFI|nr:hypothetical protein RFI_04220 [Reticulomyxa filosa]|eukprot:ETO32897.1 hypothetical protein RFI_04220 [Reticulomyxa filosa]